MYPISQPLSYLALLRGFIKLPLKWYRNKIVFIGNCPCFFCALLDFSTKTIPFVRIFLCIFCYSYYTVPYKNPIYMYSRLQFSILLIVPLLPPSSILSQNTYQSSTRSTALMVSTLPSDTHYKASDMALHLLQSLEIFPPKD